MSDFKKYEEKWKNNLKNSKLEKFISKKFLSQSNYYKNLLIEKKKFNALINKF